MFLSRILNVKYCTFQLQNYHLLLKLISNSLFIFYIWWSIVFISSYTSLSMASFSSLNIFIMVILKPTCQIWHSFCCLAFCVFVCLLWSQFLLFACLIISCWKQDIFSNSGYWFLSSPGLVFLLFVCLFVLGLGYSSEISFYHTVQLLVSLDGTALSMHTITMRWQCYDPNRTILSFLLFVLSGKLDGLWFSLLFLIKVFFSVSLQGNFPKLCFK